MSKGIEKIYLKHHSKNRNINKTSFGDLKGNLFKKYIKKEGLLILDIGCRSGELTRYFKGKNKVYGIDIDEVALKEAKKKGIITKKIDLNEIDKPLNEIFNLKEKFDVITAGDVIEHLYFPEDKIKIIHKSLKKNGLFIGNVPNAFFFMHRIRYLFGNIKGTPLEDPTHITQFSFNHLNNILIKYFKNIKYEPIIDKKYLPLTKLSKSLFYYGIFFVGNKK